MRVLRLEYADTTYKSLILYSQIELTIIPHDADHIFRLWGNPGHLKYMATSFRGRFSEDEVHVLVPKTNSGNFTYDGQHGIDAFE